MTLKKLDQKRYRSFRISKDISQEMFQIELPEGQIVHNVFNEDLLTQCREPYFKGQHMDLASLLEIINKEEIKQKKSGIIGNKDMIYSFWYIEKDMEMNMIIGLLKQDYHMLRRQLKTTSQEFQVETYKREE